MSTAAIALAAASSASLVAWCVNATLRGRFWTTAVRLPPGSPPGPHPSVVVVVPARDEAELLPRTLPTLLGQEYPGALSVVLVDDRSSDGTGRLARELAAGAGRALEVVEGGDPPPGWAGKVWALARGVAAAPRSEYVLLSDADVAHGPDSVSRLVALAVADDRDLVSVMARLRCEGRWERLVVPAFVYFFALLYPFRWVSSPSRRTAAAAGGCLLVRRSALEEAGGLEAIKGALIDDVSLATAVARRARGGGARLWLGLHRDVRSLRAYPRLGDLWDMVARSAYTQLQCSPLLLAGTLAGLVLLFAVPPAAVVAGAAAWGPVGAWALGIGSAAWVVQAATEVPMLRYYGLAPWRGLALPAVGLLYGAMTADSALRHWRGRGGSWRGRPAPEPA